MRLAEIAWNMVTEATLANYFRKTESESPLDIIHKSIDDLDTAVLLAPAQMPSASDLLNPCLEHEKVISKISDEAIVEATKEAYAQSLGDFAMEEDLETCRVPFHSEAIHVLNYRNKLSFIREESWARSMLI
ncbi:hypothetical protein OnM2_071041 [Erysiphe neolycopersici]|uniref:Uncharacterized protein n=1 Tax=Erysiphe neolycopersici TaxID=212602 RepID=A0A420HK92_9PEZI|nr:hypothetical protein OnM2_071041 [Erysiphe neolycopersici]